MSLSSLNSKEEQFISLKNLKQITKKSNRSKHEPYDARKITEKQLNLRRLSNVRVITEKKTKRVEGGQLNNCNKTIRQTNSTC